MQSKAEQRKAMQSNAKQRKATQSNAKQCKAKQRNAELALPYWGRTGIIQKGRRLLGPILACDV